MKEGITLRESIKTRSEIDNKYKWNIERLYKDIEAWEQDFTNLKSKVPELESFSGRLSNAKELVRFLDISVEVSRLLDKLESYAYLRGDEDNSNAEFQVLSSKISAYSAEVSTTSAFFIPELLALPEGTIEGLIKSCAELKKYEFYLEKILNKKPHMLNAEQEKLLAIVSDSLYQAEELYDMFTSADIIFPKIKDEKGNEVQLTEGNFGSFRKSKDRKVRKAAFEAYYGTYNMYRNTMAASLMCAAKTTVTESKIRNYASALESSLKPNNIPVEVYNNVIDTINKNLSSLHRYVKLKKRLLNLEEIHMYDTYMPLFEAAEDSHIAYEDGVQMILEGLSPLGEEYSNIFKEGIREGWVDVFENKGKYGGGYSRGCYDSMPYILMNYNYELYDVSTLAHEIGHSIHSYYSRKHQPYIYARSEWFCQEVASTTNECLLMDNLIKKEADKKKRLSLINEQLEVIKATVFVQTMFAEFEKITHESVEAGNPLSADDLCKIYHDLNAKYFGPDIIVDEAIDIGWASIPHFYCDFYVYQYVTGYAAACSFSHMIMEEGESAVERYTTFLKSGCNDYPIEILKKAGVDMTTPKPIEDAIKKFDELIDMLEKEIQDSKTMCVVAEK